jgi:hypothetical protein
MQRVEVEADKATVQGKTAYFYNKDEESPEAVVLEASSVIKSRGVRYFMDMSDELATAEDFGKSVGLRILMKTSLHIPGSSNVEGAIGSHRYLVEDATAPAEVEGHLVKIVCQQELVGRNQFRYWISDWEVVE